jgi:hypothetical protein
MKTIKNLMLMVAITFSTVLFANEKPKTNDDSNLRNEIIQILNKTNFESKQNLEAVVRITFNRNKEIVVLSVDTENAEFKNFIKHKLNYSKVSESIVLKKDRYIIPIKLRTK